MLALLTALVIHPLVAQDASDFRISYAKRKGDIATEVPDPAIQKCMDLVMAKVRRDVKANSSPADLEKISSYFSGVVSNEEVFSTDYRSVGVQASWTAGRVAIGVRMGEVGRLGVFNATNGRAIPVPKEMAWSYRYDTAPMFIPGGLLIVNGHSIQDAGVRYTYRLHFLKSGEKGYTLGRTLKGTWNLNEEKPNLHVNGLVATVLSIDSPKSFLTDNVTPLFTKQKIVRLGTWPITIADASGIDSVQVVDEWMWESMKNPKTQMQRDFAKLYGKKPQFLDGYRAVPKLPDSYEITLELEKTFVFLVRSTGFKMTVTSFREVKD